MTHEYQTAADDSTTVNLLWIALGALLERGDGHLVLTQEELERQEGQFAVEWDGDTELLTITRLKGENDVAH